MRLPVTTAIGRAIQAGADVDAINSIYELENEPSAGGFDVIAAALQPAWDSLGIAAEEIGELS